MWVGRRVAVDDEPTVIIPFNARRQSYLIRNADDTDSVVLGGEDVAFDEGFALPPGQSASAEQLSQMTRESKADLYGICDTGEEASVHVLEYLEAALDGSVPT